MEENNKRPWVNKVINFFKRIFSDNKPIMSAEEAYKLAVYGKNMSDKEIINKYQQRINTLISNKITPHSCTDNSYYCVIDFELFIKPYIDDILKPFYDGGYKIINLSDIIPEIEDNMVYLLSWRK